MKKVCQNITTIETIGDQDVEETRLVVHYDGAAGEDALCGQSLTADNLGTEYWDDSIETTKRVNCQDCITVRDYVLGVNL